MGRDLVEMPGLEFRGLWLLFPILHFQHSQQNQITQSLVAFILNSYRNTQPAPIWFQKQMMCVMLIANYIWSEIIFYFFIIQPVLIDLHQGKVYRVLKTSKLFFRRHLQKSAVLFKPLNPDCKVLLHHLVNLTPFLPNSGI